METVPPPWDSCSGRRGPSGGPGGEGWRMEARAPAPPTTTADWSRGGVCPGGPGEDVVGRRRPPGPIPPGGPFDTRLSQRRRSLLRLEGYRGAGRRHDSRPGPVETGRRPLRLVPPFSVLPADPSHCVLFLFVCLSLLSLLCRTKCVCRALLKGRTGRRTPSDSPVESRPGRRAEAVGVPRREPRDPVGGRGFSGRSADTISLCKIRNHSFL